MTSMICALVVSLSGLARPVFAQVQEEESKADQIKRNLGWYNQEPRLLQIKDMCEIVFSAWAEQDKCFQAHFDSPINASTAISICRSAPDNKRKNACFHESFKFKSTDDCHYQHQSEDIKVGCYDDYFLRNSSRKRRRPSLSFEKASLKIFRTYVWPPNQQLAKETEPPQRER